MSFKLIAQIKSKLTGLDLDDEYDRLGFDEIRRPEKFPLKQLTFEVDKEFVRNNRSLFESESTATIFIDSKDTNSDDWEDWGSAGSMLSQDNFTLDRAMSLSGLAE